jgi:uncharacterized membrane protein YgcG
MLLAGVLALMTAATGQSAPSAAAPATAATGQTAQAAPATFSIHGVVRSGSTNLPGVTVTATHSLTGRKVITSTDVDGSFHLELPGKGRWVLRAEFSAFAAQTAEVMITPAQPEGIHNFELLLLSRAPKPTTEAGESPQEANGNHTQHAAGNGRAAQRLSLSADDAALAQAAGSSDSDVPSGGISGLATSADATNQSLSVTGRMGNAQDFGLQNMDDLRERIDEMRARGQLPGGDGAFSGPGGAGGSGGPFIFGGGGGGGGGGRMRLGSLTKPHGQIYYTASNSVLDAAPYAINGHGDKPSYGSNRFGGMVGGPLKIPHVYDDGGKTFLFLNYSGTRSTTPYDQFSHVPTLLERAGDFSHTTSNGSPVQLVDPSTGAAIAGDCIGSAPGCYGAISTQSAVLLNYIPRPNIAGTGAQNFRFTSAGDSDQDIFALRLTHNFGAANPGGLPFPPPGMGGGGRGGRPRNNLNFGINYQRNESEILQPFPTVGGSTHTNGYNAFAGWAWGKGKLSNQFRFTWNRSRAHTGNLYGNVDDIEGPASDPLIGGVSYEPINWGVPSLAFTHYQGLSDVAPSQRDSQTYTLSENFGWVKSKHHLHFGGDFRWIDNKYYASTNPRGSFTFTGISSGYDFADFLLGLPQSTSLAYSAVHDEFKTHGYDFFVQDDWRWKGNLSFNLGLRYEYIAPFHEASNYLANMQVVFIGDNFIDAIPLTPNGIYGRALLHPDRNNFAPRVGLAWKPFGNKTVIRAGYGINYNLGQYASIVQNLAAQPPYSVTQTNTSGTLTLANGFPTPESSQVTNNYAVDPKYRTAYVQMWNLNIQHEFTSTLLLNVGYTGSKGSKLDMLRAPNRGPNGLLVSGIDAFNWETSQGASILNAGTVRLRKRMSRGIAVGGTYTYSKSIDNASSIGGTSQVVAQNDKDLAAERGLSSFDQRHKLTGDWTYELPWGEGRHWLTRPGVAQKTFGDWLLQSSFSFASGTPFTARVLGSFGDVAGGTNGTLRANATGQSIHVSHRSIDQWFNTNAFCTGATGKYSCLPYNQPTSGYGDAGRNTIIGPGAWLMSLVLSKNFPIHDQMGIEARAEADNVLNHPNYSTIDTAVNSPTYGQVTGVSSMRKMILSLHYRF